MSRRLLKALLDASAVAVFSLAGATTTFAETVLKDCSSATILSHIQGGGGTAANGCEYLYPPDNSTTADLATINDAAFFGSSDWEVAVPKQDFPDGAGQSGSWSIPGYDPTVRYLIVFKDGSDTNLIGFTLISGIPSGTWTTPFTNPPFSGVIGSKDVTHFTIFKGVRIFSDGFELLPECEPGETEICYEGPPDTEGIGQCTAGTRNCQADGQWGSCDGSVVPSEEICGDDIDNDCDGGNPGCAGDSCEPLDSEGSCDAGLGCYITSCRDIICVAECSAGGSGRAGSACDESADCQSGLQCWGDSVQSACFQSCDPADLFSCPLGSACNSTGIFVDGQEIGACSLP